MNSYSCDQISKLNKQKIEIVKPLLDINGQTKTSSKNLKKKWQNFSTN